MESCQIDCCLILLLSGVHCSEDDHIKKHIDQYIFIINVSPKPEFHYNKPIKIFNLKQSMLLQSYVRIRMMLETCLVKC